MEFHELAQVFPLMEGEDYEALKANIAEHGLAPAVLMARAAPALRPA